MPYVDKGEAKPVTLPPIVPFLAAFVAAGVGAASWLGSFKWFNMSYPGAIFAGLLIGLAVKFTLRRPIPQFRVVCIVLTVLACIAGYVGVFAAYYTNFSVSASISTYFKDFQALIFTGVGCYIAFILASPRLNAPPSERASI